MKPIFSHIRDDRPKKTRQEHIPGDRLKELVDISDEIHGKCLDRNGRFCTIKLMDCVLPNVVSDYDFLPNNFFFEGMRANVQAFCDFKRGRHIHAREELWNRILELDSEAEKVVLAHISLRHDAGHLLAEHGRKLKARNRGVISETNLRLAHNQSILAHPVYSHVRHYSATDHPDLERESDIIMFGLSVRIKSLTGEEGVRYLARSNGITENIAYGAAMIAKDYHRALLLGE